MSARILPVAEPAAVRRYVLQTMRRHPKLLAGTVGMYALAAIAGLAGPRLLGDLVQSVVNGTTVAHVSRVAIVLLAFVVLQSLLISGATPGINERLASLPPRSAPSPSPCCVTAGAPQRGPPRPDQDWAGKHRLGRGIAQDAPKNGQPIRRGGDSPSTGGCAIIARRDSAARRGGRGRCAMKFPARSCRRWRSI